MRGGSVLSAVVMILRGAFHVEHGRRHLLLNRAGVRRRGQSEGRGAEDERTDEGRFLWAWGGPISAAWQEPYR